MDRKRIPKNIVRLIENYTNRLEREYKTPVKRVILYGSQVQGTPHKWSDIDVCLISSQFKHPMDAMVFLLQKRSREEMLAGLEPVGFTPEHFREGGSLINEIKRTGLDMQSYRSMKTANYIKLREKFFAGKDAGTLDREIRKFNRK